MHHELAPPTIMHAAILKAYSVQYRSIRALCVKMISLFVLWILFLKESLCSQTVESENLYIMLMVSNSTRFNTSGVAVAFNQALERINSDPSLLNGYELNLSVIIDNKVSIFNNFVYYVGYTPR